MAERLRRDGTRERVLRGTFPARFENLKPVMAAGWVRRRFDASDVTFDATTTDSLVTPVVGKLTWKGTLHRTDVCPSEEAAAKAALVKRPVARTPIHADLAFQNGGWVLKEVWLDGGQSIGIIRATTAADDNSLKEWWWALGGK